MLGVVVINFVLIHLAPGSFLELMTAENQVSDPATVELLRKTYGLDDPMWLQLLKYIWALLHFDFGFSYRQNMPVLAGHHHQPAGDPAADGVEHRARLRGRRGGGRRRLDEGAHRLGHAGLGRRHVLLRRAELLARHHDDRAVRGEARLDAGRRHGDDRRPGQQRLFGGILDILHHLILPTLALGLFYAAIYARVMRSSMLEVAQLDFVRTARAKGLSRRQVTIGHVLRNALLPVVTILGVQMGTVLAGSVVIESVFSWPGVGSLLFDSVSSRNYPVVLGIMVLGSLVVITANIAVDLIYMWLDPRIEIR